MTNSTDTICAVGTPKNVQLSARGASPARTGRCRTRRRRPGAGRPAAAACEAWKPIQIRTSAPSAPESDSYRKSGWKRVEVSGQGAAPGSRGRAAIRWAQSIGIPHGSVVGEPYSSWLKKLPQRAMACIVNRPGAMMSAQRRNGAACSARTGTPRSSRCDPAVDAEPRVRRQEDLDRVVLVERPLVDDVVQPTADQRRDRDDDHPVAEDVGVLAGPPRQPDHDQVGGGQPERIADAVPVDGQRPELDGDRVRA